MLIKVNDPYSHQLMELNARPEELDGQQGWRIRFPYKFSFFLAWRQERWEVVDDIDIHPQLLQAISLALHPLALVNSFYLQPLSTFHH